MMENEMELQEEQAAEKRKKDKKGMSVLLQLVLLVVLALLLRNVMGTVLVKGSSMEPNFYHGDFVFINKLSTAFGSLQKGDVVICRLDEEKKNIIKRVIGLPGDVIDFRETDGGEDTIYALYINDELVREDYIKAPMDSKGNIDYPYTVPENSYFVMGDNRNASSDSRRKSVGAIEKEDLMGKVIFRLYPFGSMGFIK